MSDKAVYRTAPATPGLLTIVVLSETLAMPPISVNNMTKNMKYFQ